MKSTHLPHRPALGFTLIEVMVVLVIIALMAGLIAPNLIGKGEEAKVKTATTDIATLGSALDIYRLDNSTYPSTDQGLEALVSQPGGSPQARNWKGPYIKKLSKDPWNNDYIYISSGETYELLSTGADGLEGGEGVAADISSAQ